MTNMTTSVQEEFNEQVQSVYRRSKSKQEADRELITQGDALLDQIDVLAASSEEFQVYIWTGSGSRNPRPCGTP